MKRQNRDMHDKPRKLSLLQWHRSALHLGSSYCQVAVVYVEAYLLICYNRIMISESQIFEQIEIGEDLVFRKVPDLDGGCSGVYQEWMV